jgi:glycosyltransferase involved in cell wall biosynthesis
MIEYFANEGHEVHIISLPSVLSKGVSSTKQAGIGLRGVQVHIIRANKINLITGLSTIFQVRKILSKIKPDILHAHYVTHYGVIGAFSGFHPLIISPWGSDILVNLKKSKLYEIITKYALKKADLITCDGENVIKVLKTSGIRSEKIKYIPFGTDIEKFNPKQRNKSIWKKLNVNNSPVIISLRDFKPLYDVGTLIRAIPLVLNHIPKAKFIIGGVGPQELELKKLGRMLDVHSSVKFVSRIPSDELPKYLASADIYVSTSLSDSGLSASTAEAMSCQLPVIITDFGDNKKWTKDMRQIFPSRDSEALANKIIYFLNHEYDRRKSGELNRKMIVEKNNYYKRMEKLGKIYKTYFNTGDVKNV